MFHGQRRRVRAKAEVTRVAERDHAAGPEQQAQARREQCEYQHVGHEYQCVVVDHERQQRQRNDADGADHDGTMRDRGHCASKFGKRGCRRDGRRTPEQALRLERQHDRHEHELGNQCQFRERDGHASDIDRARVRCTVT